MGAFKDKILNELYKNNYRDLYNTIDKIESDVDVANYLSANHGYFNKTMSTKDLEGMPELRKALYSELKTGDVDLDKEFGKDWYKDYENIPMDQIKFVAEKQGDSFGNLVMRMGKEANEKRRKDIADGKDAGDWLDSPEAFGHNVAGTLMSIFTPRQQEAIARGDDYTNTDFTLDMAQNAMYMAPWGRAAKLVPAAAQRVAPVVTNHISGPLTRLLSGTTGRVAEGTAINAATPTIMEAADAVAYDDSNPRGDFNTGDIVTETAVNMSTPWLLKGMAMGAGKWTTGKGRDVAKQIMDYGTDRPTRQSMSNEVKNTYTKELTKNQTANMADYYGNPTLSARAASLNYTQQDLNRLAMASKLADYAKELEIARKTKGAVKPSIKFTDEEVKFISKDPELSKYLDMDINYPKLPSEWNLAGEEAAKNYFTNQLGTYWYDEQSPWTRLPVIGTKLDQYVKERDKEAELQAKKESIIKHILEKYGRP